MTDTEPLDAFRVSEGVVFRELEGEAVLLNLDSGMYFGLDQVGTRVWQLLAEHQRVPAVIEKMLEEYEVGREALEADVARLVAALLDKGLLVQGDAAGDP
jgi:hypothetical protein